MKPIEESVTGLPVIGMPLVGQPLNRTDGHAKVTGAARYAAEHDLAGLVHAVIVTSTIARGRITAIDSTAAEKMRGVLLAMTHLNAPALPDKGQAGAAEPPSGRVLNLLQDDEVRYNNQPVAVVVADTLDHARDAARALRIAYATQGAVLDFDHARDDLVTPEKVQGSTADSARGDDDAGWRDASSRIDVCYTTPVENHNPLEPHATVAVWEGTQLTLYDSTQYVTGDRNTVAKTLGIAADDVRVICPFVGGGFGCKGSTWSHVVLAAMVSRATARPVKLVLDRTQMFGMVGYRPQTEQRLQIGAVADGRMTALRHDAISGSAFQENWIEPSAILTRMLYDSDSQRTTHRLARLDYGVPTFMRAPGEASGSFALESALDELACALQIDPIALRLRNHADKEPEKGLPWSSKSLRQCYEEGAQRFGWADRNPVPRSMRHGDLLVGWGMASATYPANRQAAHASATIDTDGSAVVRSGSQDLGTGTYTVMTQIAADALGLPIEKVRFELGDTNQPKAPVSGGSQTVASVGPAVHAAAMAARRRLIDLAIGDTASPLHGSRAEDIGAEAGWLFLHAVPARREPMTLILARNGGQPITATSESKPGEEKKKFSMHSFGAVFAEVHVDPDLGTVTVPRIVGAYGIGKLMNRKTGHSQLMGGVVWGVGMALQEKRKWTG
jgi:xanthine dehydrogenase YagR molybdenum-binding subunit